MKKSELIDEMARRGGEDASAFWYSVLLLKAEPDAPELYKIFDAEKCCVFSRGISGCAVLIKDATEETLHAREERCIDGIKGAASLPGIYYFGGLGDAVGSLAELASSFDSAGRAFVYRFLETESGIIKCAELEQGVSALRENAMKGFGDIHHLDRAKMRDFLRFGDADEVRFFVREYFKRADKNQLQSSILRQYVMMDAYFCVVTFLETIRAERDEIDRLPTISYSVMESVDNALYYITDLFRLAVETRDRKRRLNGSQQESSLAE